MSKRKVRFGILGPGKIANRFTDSFTHVPDAEVVAVASRDGERARLFAEKHRIPRSYDSYDKLILDPEVDIIYVATPHPFHFENTMQCLHGGKAVLCEKPLAMNLRQAKEMIDTARKNNVFLMEGMWSRFFPATHKALEVLNAGSIGELKFLEADFGFAAPVNPEGRVYNLALGGGSQLDVGVYPLFFALLMLGKPLSVKSFSQLAATGADATTSALLQFGNGAIAHIYSSIVADSPKMAHLLGTEGRITLAAPWHKSQEVIVRFNSGESNHYSFPHSGNGFEFQVDAVAQCIREGKKECDLMPHSLSLLMAETADEILRQGGVRYSSNG
jgi:predicted dehydrogenase